MDETNPRDKIEINGSSNIALQFEHPINGDKATAAIAVNAIPSVIKAQPGLRTMADVEVISYWD